MRSRNLYILGLILAVIIALPLEPLAILTSILELIRDAFYWAFCTLMGAEL